MIGVSLPLLDGGTATAIACPQVDSRRLLRREIRGQTESGIINRAEGVIGITHPELTVAAVARPQVDERAVATLIVRQIQTEAGVILWVERTALRQRIDPNGRCGRVGWRGRIGRYGRVSRRGDNLGKGSIPLLTATAIACQ